MAWIGSPANTLGIGESSQGMDRGAVGSGLGADALGNIFDSNYRDTYGLRALADQRAKLGLKARVNDIDSRSPEMRAYLRELTREIDILNRKAKQIPYSLYPPKVRDLGKFFGPPVQQSRQTFYDHREEGRQREDFDRAVLDADTIAARALPAYRDFLDFTPARSKIANVNNYRGLVDPKSGWHGVNTLNFTPGSDDDIIDGGADPYMYTRRRSPDYAAYVDLYNDLVAAQPAGMSKSDWGRRHWERHGGQEGRDFYGPSQINYPMQPDGTQMTEFRDYAQPPAFGPLAYKNAWTGVRQDPYMTASEA